MIQNKQLENTLKLAKGNKIIIDGKEYKKKPLTAKQWREIVQLNQKMAEAKTELARTDILLEMRQKGALYYFDIPAEIFDTHYEKIGATIEGHILRSNMGANADIEFEEILKKFSNFNNSDQPVAAIIPIQKIIEEKKNNNRRRHKNKDGDNT